MRWLFRTGDGRETGHRRNAVVMVVCALLVAALIGGAGGARIGAQDNGGGLVFNTPTPSGDDDGLEELEPTPEDEGDDEDDEDDEDDSGGITQRDDEDDDDGEVAEEVAFGAGDWIGGFLRDDSAFYGRPWTALYGAESDFFAATLYFTLSDDPEEPILLTFDGLDDEESGNNPIAVEINGQRIFEGESWFESWDGVGDGADAAWTTVRFSIPPELLMAGTNTVTFYNNSDAANFSSPPYILLAEGTIASSESGIFGDPGDIDFEIDVLGSNG